MWSGAERRAQADAGDEINLGTIARAVWRNKRAIIAPTILIAVAAFIGVNLITPRYKSEARVLIEGRENIFLRPECREDAAGPRHGRCRDRHQPGAARAVARPRPRGHQGAQSRRTAGVQRGAEGVLAAPGAALVGILRDPMSMSLEERVFAAYYDRLQAFALDKSRVISIEFQSADPDLAAKIANLIAEKYLTFQQVAKQDQARSASKWLSGELDKLRDKVSRKPKARSRHSAPSPICSSAAAPPALANQQLADLSTQVSAARRAEGRRRGAQPG